MAHAETKTTAAEEEPPIVEVFLTKTPIVPGKCQFAALHHRPNRRVEVGPGCSTNSPRCASQESGLDSIIGDVHTTALA